jgi:hypothetical protein
MPGPVRTCQDARHRRFDMASISRLGGKQAVRVRRFCLPSRLCCLRAVAAPRPCARAGGSRRHGHHRRDCRFQRCALRSVPNGAEPAFRRSESHLAANRRCDRNRHVRLVCAGPGARKRADPVSDSADLRHVPLHPAAVPDGGHAGPGRLCVGDRAPARLQAGNGERSRRALSLGGARRRASVLQHRRRQDQRAAPAPAPQQRGPRICTRDHRAARDATRSAGLPNRAVFTET